MRLLLLIGLPALAAALALAIPANRVGRLFHRTNESQGKHGSRSPRASHTIP